MAITRLNPNTILLFGDPAKLIDEFVAGEAITPGHLAQLADYSGTNKWKKNASATEYCPLYVALDRPAANKGVDDAYAIADLVPVQALQNGDRFWGLIASGQDISNGEYLQSAGDGTLKSATATTADANVVRFQSLDNPGAVTALTRIRVMVIA